MLNEPIKSLLEVTDALTKEQWEREFWIVHCN